MDHYYVARAILPVKSRALIGSFSGYYVRCNMDHYYVARAVKSRALIGSFAGYNVKFNMGQLSTAHQDSVTFLVDRVYSQSQYKFISFELPNILYRGILAPPSRRPAGPA